MQLDLRKARQITCRTTGPMPGRAPPAAGRHNPPMPGALEQTALANGVRILSCRQPGDRFALGLWLRHGSRHEAADRRGHTHLLEHLWLAGICGAATGPDQLNARTGRELTGLYGSIPAPRWRELTERLGTLLLNPRFSDADLARERTAIACERRCHEPGRTEDLACAALWPDHPLGRPVAGPPGALASADAASLHRYHRELLCGARLGVTAVGPVAHRLLVDACAPLGELAAGTLPEVRRPPRIPGPRHRPVGRENPLWALPTAGWSDPNLHALLLAGQLVGGTSGLFGRLAGEGARDCALGARLTLFGDAGLLLVEAAAPPRRRAECRAAVERALAALAAGAAAPGDLARAVAALGARLDATGEPLALVQRLGRELWYLPGLPGVDQRRAALAAVTPGAVARVLGAAWRDRVVWP